MEPETIYYPEDHPWVEMVGKEEYAQEIGLSEEIFNRDPKMWTISCRTVVTSVSSGTRATGRRSATGIAASRHAEKTATPSTVIEKGGNSFPPVLV